MAAPALGAGLATPGAAHSLSKHASATTSRLAQQEHAPRLGQS
ncbi:hypothetical protein A2U01_0091972, partial [Trifolium medium]|nr:hypothetical protein [Trifolium medium]